MNNIINITSGDLLNDILKKDNELWIPFREALIVGTHSNYPFTNEFISERISSLKTTKDEYFLKMKPFIDFINNLNDYSIVNMYFGEEPFCKENYTFILNILKDKEYKGTINLNIVDETNGKILKTNQI